MEDYHIQLASLVYLLFLSVVLFIGYYSHLQFLDDERLERLRQLRDERDSYEGKATALSKELVTLEKDFSDLEELHWAQVNSIRDDREMMHQMYNDANREYRAALLKYNQMRG